MLGKALTNDPYLIRLQGTFFSYVITTICTRLLVISESWQGLALMQRTAAAGRTVVLVQVLRTVSLSPGLSS